MKVYNKYILKNGKELIIRSADGKDAEKELEFYKKEVSETPFLSRGDDDEMPSKEGFIENYEYYLDDQRACTLVAIYEDKLIGSGHIDYCGNKKRSAHRCDIDLGVLKEYWGLGVGGKIMQTLLDVAKKSNFEQVELSVASKNERAIKMYESFGFQKTGIIPRSLKYSDGTYEDYVCMTKFF